MRQILTKSASVVRTKAREVENPHAPEIRELVFAMKDAMRKANGIGLAAPQIGEPLRIFVAEVNKKFYVAVNPNVTKVSEETEEMEEGCLSVPGLWGPVERAARVTLEAFDQNGKPYRLKAKGLLARVIQHEMDHLDGILFIDKAKALYEIRRQEKHGA